MLQRIQSSINKIPPGGLALHGTSYKKALSIAESGLLYDGYHCPIPNPNSNFYTSIPSTKEFFSKTVGSIIFSSAYANRAIFAPESSTPAIVIFADWNPDSGLFNTGGYDLDLKFIRYSQNFEGVSYDSFGKDILNIPAQYVCAISHLSAQKLQDISERAKKNSGGDLTLERLLSLNARNNFLIINTLSLIEKICALSKNPEKLISI